MKELNKILYDILLKFNLNKSKDFYMVGGIDEAIEKAKKLEAEAA